MKLYLIVHETDLFGTWDDPKKAVEDHYRWEIKNEPNFDIDAKVAEMLEPGCDYPHFIILEAGKRFSMDR